MGHIRASYVCFTKNWIEIGAKVGKHCHWTKTIKDAEVYGRDRQIFPKSPKEAKAH